MFCGSGHTMLEGHLGTHDDENGPIRVRRPRSGYDKTTSKFSARNDKGGPTEARMGHVNKQASVSGTPLDLSYGLQCAFEAGVPRERPA